MTAVLVLLAVIIQVAALRGGPFHSLIVGRCDRALRRAGFTTELESSKRLPDGRRSAIDILAKRGAFIVAVEIETTPRGAASNVEKAAALDLPLWIVAPNRRVVRALRRRIHRTESAGDGRFRILLLPAFEQGLMPGGDLILAANESPERETENRKEHP